MRPLLSPGPCSRSNRSTSQAPTPKLYASSEQAQRGFCETCGTPISFAAAYIPGLIDLTIGSMDQPDTITPQFHYWHSKHLAWAEFADTLPRHPEFPPLG